MGVTQRCIPNGQGRTPACNKGINEPTTLRSIDENDLRNQAYKNPLHMIADWLGFTIFHAPTGAARTRGLLASALRVVSNCLALAPASVSIGCRYAIRPRWLRDRGTRPRRSRMCRHICIPTC